MSSKTDIFLDKYKQLENVVKAEYDLGRNDSAISFLVKRKEFCDLENELDLCRETRNLLSHNPKVKNEYAVEPSEGMINLLDEIIAKIEHPLRARNVMIHKNQLCYKGMEDSVREAMVAMHENSYTHIPILENGVLQGIFSEKVLLAIMIDEAFAGINPELRFADIREYVSYKDNRAENYRFVAQEMLVSEIGKMYKDTSNRRERIGMIFVTQNGNDKEKIMGIITAWEIAAEIDVV